MVATNPLYRNNRSNYYQEKGPDTVSVGSIINVFKTKDNTNSYDSSFIPTNNPVNGISAYEEISGDANAYLNPEYQYYGYLYCDGSEYNIKDYPLLFSIIGNDYGGTPGVINGVPMTKENVFLYWPEENMGTFAVPDLLAKKIVGYGPVYGAGTPTIANISMEIGATGGFWYLNKDTQKGYFNLGNVKTTGYTNVVGDAGGKVQGSQVVTVTLFENDLNQAPEHSHQLLHSEAPEGQGWNSGAVVDPYLSGYKNKTGKTLPFNPPGTKLTHTHALTKQQFSGSNIATYDIFNYRGGSNGPGSIKDNGNFWASGASGQFVEISYTPNPLFRRVLTSSVIGGVDIVEDGTPVYEDEEFEYTSAGTDIPFGISTDIDQIVVDVYGGGGSGGVWTQQGNDGTASSVKLGDGTAITITAGGGLKGGAVSESTSSIPYTETKGAGGNGGTNFVTGDASALITVTNNYGSGDIGINGYDGSQGKFYKGEYSATDPNWGGLAGGYATGGRGSDGKYLNVTSTAVPYSVDVTYPNTGTFNVVPTQAYWYIQNATINLYGSRGRNCGNLSCSTGLGGAGKYVSLSVKEDDDNIIAGTFNFYPGQRGQVYPNYSEVLYGVGDGGRGGNGYGSNDGGGGGAATVVTAFTSGGAEYIAAGAGGGGGGGGFGEGQCGDNATGNATIDTPQGTTQTLFSGGGGVGGNYGCTGGGGGGGGGGVGTAGQTGSGQGPEGGAGAGGNGGGGGGTGGHGGGYGGARGITSYNVDKFSVVASGDSGEVDGRITGTATENRSYWTSSAGGGGGGGWVQATIPKEVWQNSGDSSLLITVGSGGAGVSSSISNRTIDNSIAWTENAGTVSSLDANDGYVKVTTKTLINIVGGTTITTTGDIVIKASTGVEIYSSGTGVGTAGGFKLPQTQVPTVEVTPQGDLPGSGCTAQATVNGLVVSDVTVTNGGSGYTQAPKVRFLNGCGGETTATSTIDANGVVTDISLTTGSSKAYEKYVKFGGPELERYVVLAAQDCTDVVKFGIKCARGNNNNGGELPDDSGDELLLYYNTDGTLNFPASNFIGTLVPRATAAQITSNYDGTGTGVNPTNWYSYFLELPGGAQQPGVRFKIVQKRLTANTSNDNGGNNDHFGICEFIYDYAFISETQFQGSPGEISKDAETLTYVIEGNDNALYPAGLEVNDMTFTLDAGTPLTPTPALSPDKEIPLVEPYALTKYLIKAF